MDKINLGISSCLLGEPVRYDGGHKLDPYITETLGQYFSWVPVCPEVESGLPVPREPMRLVGDPHSPRLLTKHTNIDHTRRLKDWTVRRLRELGKAELCGFIFKSKSPTSGMSGVKVYQESGVSPKRGAGIFGGAFVERFPLVPVIDEGRMHNPSLRENFIERVFTYHRWLNFSAKSKTLGKLVEFHTAHKYMVMAHSPKHYRELGALVASGKKMKLPELYDRYITLLMEALSLTATVKKNANVLQHLMGYFKKDLSLEEKKELIGLIDNYHRELVPLIVPVTMIKHYVAKFDVKYLKGQLYLTPHPLELMLRNHV